MAIVDKQQEAITKNQGLEPAKPPNPTLDEIRSFHAVLESERIHRVLVRWRKRKRDEELMSGTVILEKILRTLHDELESRRERAGLWDQALFAELEPDRARQELDGRPAASALSLEKRAQFLHAAASVLNIEVSSEEVGRMLSKTTAPTDVPAAQPPGSMPSAPPADRDRPVMPYDTRTLVVDTNIKEPDSKRLPVAPRMPAPSPRRASQGGGRDDHTTSPQGLRPQGSGDARSPTRTETADHHTSTPPNKKSRTNGPSALRAIAPEKKLTRSARNVRVSD